MASINLKCFKFLPKSRFLAATILSIGSCLGAIATTLQPAPAAIMGQDDRVTAPYWWLSSTGQPQAAVGLLWGQQAGGGYYNCTFTVIGRNIGLTNAHCIYDEQGRPPQQLKAYVGLYGNSYAAAANVDYYWIGIDTPPKTLQDRTGDWAIVRFTSNLGDTTGWYGTATWNPNDISTAGQGVVDSTANYIGYPSDWPTDAAIKQGDMRGYTPAAQFGCKIIDNYIGLLWHDCDVTPGTSGSSLFTIVTQTNWNTVGLNSSELQFNDGSYINIAVPLERFMPAVLKLRQTGATPDTAVPRP